MKKILLIGGGGHCKVVAAQVRAIGDFEIVGIVDRDKPLGTRLFGTEVIGFDKDLSLLRNSIPYALITLGSTKDNSLREKLFRLAEAAGFEFPVIIAPSAYVRVNAAIAAGTVIMPGCIVNDDCTIGKNCIINSGSIVEHDVAIGNHCHICPGACVSGNVKIGDLSFIGAGATIIQSVTIGNNVTVGAGSVVIKDIPDRVIAAGNPARILSKIT